eukprot:Phypoly_transcript_15108.p1 GENE.Phypoly_transcript_15108~~Phypoly_transcript_15108.p1  ORF type:complete len:180 (-),score=28.41 Phypoly_transcript_15108:229-768(-)
MGFSQISYLGHDDVIQCVAVSIDMDIVASGSRDGTCIIHSLISGKYLRSLSLSDSVDLVKISPTGDIATFSKRRRGDIINYCATTGVLWGHTINGQPMGSEAVEAIDCFIFDRAGRFLITGSHAGGEKAVQVRQMTTTLPIIYRFACESGVRALELVCDQKYLVVSLEDGKLMVFECNL